MTDPPIQYGDHVELIGEPNGAIGVVRAGPPTNDTAVPPHVYVEFLTGVCGWYSPDELVRVGANGEAK